MNIDAENVLLRRIVINMYKNQKYNNDYISYLLKGMTDEQFKKVAEGHVDEYDECDDNFLLESSKYLSQLLETRVSPVHLAMFLNLNPLDVIMKFQKKEWKGEET